MSCSYYCESCYGDGYRYGAWCRTCTRLASRGDFSTIFRSFAFVVLETMCTVTIYDFGYDFDDGSSGDSPRDCSSSGPGCWFTVPRGRAGPSRARRDRTRTRLA